MRRKQIVISPRSASSRINGDPLQSSASSRMLKNSFWPRLLKKVQMQGGAPILSMGTRRGARRTYTYAAAPRERAGHPPKVGHRRWASISSLLGLDCGVQGACGRLPVEGDSMETRPEHPAEPRPIVPPPPHPALNAMLICDVAFQDEASGKTSLIGVFETVTAFKFPARHGRLCVYA